MIWQRGNLSSRGMSFSLRSCSLSILFHRPTVHSHQIFWISLFYLTPWVIYLIQTNRLLLPARLHQLLSLLPMEMLRLLTLLHIVTLIWEIISLIWPLILLLPLLLVLRLMQLLIQPLHILAHEGLLETAIRPPTWEIIIATYWLALILVLRSLSQSTSISPTQPFPLLIDIFF